MIKEMNAKRTGQVWNLIRNFRFQSMFFRYFISLFLVILLAFIGFGALVLRYYDENNRQERFIYLSKMLEKTTELFDVINLQIERDFYMLSHDESMLEWLRSDHSFIDTSSGRWTLKTINDALFQAVATNRHVDSIYVHNLATGYIVTSNERKYLNDFYDRLWLKKYESTGAQDLVYARRKYAHNPSYDTITFCKAIYGKDPSTSLGVLVFNVNYDALEGTLNPESDERVENLDIATGDGRVFFSTRRRMLGNDLNADIPIESIFGRALRQLTESMIAEDTYGRTIAVSKARQSDIFLFSTQGAHGFLENHTVLPLMLIGGLSGLLLSFGLSAVVSMSHYCHIIRLIELFQLPMRPATGGVGELGLISHNIINMMNRNQHVEQELAIKFAELKKAQAIALQTQINPHFLFNTLNMVSLNIIAQQHGDNDATRIISLLCDILHDTLNTTDYLVAFREELTTARKYLEIQHMKYGDMFIVEEDVDAGLLDVCVPRLLLQPLLENAVSHGLTRSARSDKRIVISAQIESNRFALRVKDNGAGMAYEDLMRIEASFRDNALSETTHIGLSNIDKRLKIIFGVDSGIVLESIVDQGTCITIRIPLTP